MRTTKCNDGSESIEPVELTVSDWLQNNEYAKSYRSFLAGLGGVSDIQPAHDKALLHAFDVIKSAVPGLKVSQPSLGADLDKLLTCMHVVEKKISMETDTPLFQVSFEGGWKSG